MRNKLREARERQRMTQKEVAEYLGVSERMYKFIEYGERTGNISIWDALEDLFNVHQRSLRENVAPVNNQQKHQEYRQS